MKLYIPRHPSLVSVEKYASIHGTANEIEKVAAITGKKVEEIRHLNFETIDNTISLFEAGMKKDVAPMKRVIKIKTGLFSSVRLGFIPDLNNMSYYEFTTIDQLAREYIAGNTERLIDLVCVLFRPITWKMGKRYAIQKYDSLNVHDYQMAVELMKMDQVINAVFFFSNISNELRRTMPEYLSTGMKNQMEKIRGLQP